MFYRLKTSLVIYLFTLSNLALSSTGDGKIGPVNVPVITVVSEKIAQDGTKLEMINLLPRNNQEDAEAIKYAAKELTNKTQSTIKIYSLHQEGNREAKELLQKFEHNLVTQIDQKNLTESQKKEVEIHQVAAKQDFTESLKTSGLKGFLAKHERISLSLLRTSVNGTIVSLGLILNAGLPPITAMSIGLLTGSLSGLAQYFNPQLQRLLEGNVGKNERLKEQGRVGTTKVKIYQLTRWFALEASIYSVINLFSYGVGVPAGGLTQEALKVVKSSLMATASQGVWDATIASETRQELRTQSSLEEQKKIQTRSNVITFGVSMVSVFGGILTLMGTNLGTWTLGVLGVTGLLYAGRNYLRQYLAQGPKKMKFHAISCRQIFAL